MEEVKRVELAEMPSQELLERFLTQLVVGTEVQVYFDTEARVFVALDE